MRPREANKRLTTILMADVVGYSALMAADEEGTLDRLKSLRKQLIIPKEKEYRGRTAKLMGDGALMEFGSVSDALHFAIDIQLAMLNRSESMREDERIRFRIGINIGEIIVDEGDIYGAGINICARLESACEPGGIYLSESAYQQVENSTGIRFRWLGKKRLKNIPEAISIYQVLLEHPTSSSGKPVRQRRNGNNRYLIAASLVIIAFGFLAYALLYPGSAPVTEGEPRIPDGQREKASTVPDRSTKTAIAVLPFENLSDDPEQRYFSDGISEDIITDLSRLSGLAVIASASSFTYRNSSHNAQEIGDELNVDYLLQGSIRKASSRIRITSQLVNTVNGHSIWAERYDREIGDVFGLQDELTEKIVNALSLKLGNTETPIAATHKPSSFAAYDLFLQARAIANQATRESNDQTIELYRRAIELDPGFARAYAALSIVLVRTIIRGYSSDRDLTLQQAHDLAIRAVELDPKSPNALWSLGYTYMHQGKFAQATEVLERAVSLSPSFADGYGLLSLIENNQGKSLQAIEHSEKGMQLNPRYTWEYPYNLARAYWALGKHETALAYVFDATSRNPVLVQPKLYLISINMQLGNTEDANWEVTELELQHPEINLTYLNNSLTLEVSELRKKLFDDLRAAGMKD